MIIKITEAEAVMQQQATDLVTGNGLGVASIEAEVTEVKVISEFKAADNDEEATSVDTEVVVVMDLTLNYNEGYSIGLTSAFTNHVMQQEICTLRDIKDEIRGSGMFFDLSHKVICHERNKSMYAYYDCMNGKPHSLLEGGDKALNHEYQAFTPYGLLEHSLNGQGSHKDLLTKEQHKQLDKSIREQALAMLNKRFV